MLPVFVLIKDIVTILTPFVGMELYMRKVYNVDTIKVVTWWFKNHSTLDYDYSGPALIPLFFCVFALFATIAHLIQAGSLAFHGENHQLLYIGDVKKDRSLFVDPDNLKAEPEKYSGFMGGFNYSFSTVFTQTIFKRDKGTDRLGATVKSFSFISLLTSFFLLLAFIFPTMGVLHMYAYPVAVGLETASFDPAVPTMDAFNALLVGWKLGIIKVVFINSGLFIFLMVVSSKMPSEMYGKQVLDLPTSIAPGETIKGQPILIKHHTTRRSKSSGGYDDVDTGYRTIVFKFEEPFVIPVYASVYFDSTQEPTLENFAYEHIKSNSPLKLEILEDLGIKVIY